MCSQTLSSNVWENNVCCNSSTINVNGDEPNTVSSVKSSSSGGSLFDTRILTGTEGQFLDSSSNNSIISKIYINSTSSIEDASRARTPNTCTRATTSARYIHVRAPPTRARHIDGRATHSCI